ncbi:hypothetical protein [Granulicella mallensis]|nr:hypothetical protein [Granulicella mallensis]
MTSYSNSRLRQIIVVSAFAAFSFAAGNLGAQVLPGATPQASTLPANSPTTLPAPIAAKPATPTTPAHHATVTYAAGMLNVRADNSSLNQILREISRLTGMKITGGVVDERVFGNYGPAEPSTILATLLGGTGSNILLRESDTNSPTELVLTPRNGGPTPPNPNAPGFDDGAEDLPPHDVVQPAQPRLLPTRPGFPQAGPQPQATQPTSGPQSIPQPANNVNGSPSNTSPTASTLPVTDSVPTDFVPTPSTTPSTSGIVDAPNPPPPGSTTSTPSNGAKTPEQIYQQLQQLQKQQQNTTPAPTTPPATPQ